MDLSWFVPDSNVRDGYGGWVIDESSVQSKTGNKGSFVLFFLVVIFVIFLRNVG